MEQIIGKRSWRAVIACVSFGSVTITGFATPPNPISISPKPGATDVETTAVVVTFDQDMGKGMSWTGGGPNFPKSPEGTKPHWIDNRTCVFPVELEPGKVYRLGMNSTSFQNFRSASGEGALPQTIMFATKGATSEMVRAMNAPKLVKMEPAIGSTNVEASRNEISATFDQPMDSGMSWVTFDDKSPKITGKPVWSSDRKTCTAPVKLEAGKSYSGSLNGENFQNFTNELGVPLKPVDYKFTTAP